MALAPSRRACHAGRRSAHTRPPQRRPEDSGEGVRAIYGALEDAPALRLWPADADMPLPLGLAELPVAFAAGSRVHLVSGERDARDLCTGDDFVGAAMSVVALSGPRTRTERLHLVAPDRKNDWTALVRLRLGRAASSTRRAARRVMGLASQSRRAARASQHAARSALHERLAKPFVGPAPGRRRSQEVRAIWARTCEGA